MSDLYSSTYEMKNKLCRVDFIACTSYYFSPNSFTISSFPSHFDTFRVDLDFWFVFFYTIHPISIPSLSNPPFWCAACSSLCPPSARQPSTHFLHRVQDITYQTGRKMMSLKGGFNTWTIFSWNFSSTFWVYRVNNYFYRGWIIRLPREYQGSFANFIGGWSSPFSKLAFFSSLPILKQQALCSSIMSSDHPVYSIRRSKPSNPRVMSCTSCTKFFSIRNLPDDKFRWSPRKCDQWFSSLSTPSSFRQPLSCHFISDFLVSGFRFAACPWPSWLCLSVESIGFCFSFQTTINLQAFVSIDRNMPTLGRSREIRAGWEEKTIETDTLRYFHS